MGSKLWAGLSTALLLTGCEGLPDKQSSSESQAVQTTAVVQNLTNDSDPSSNPQAPAQVTQRYIYALVSGVLFVRAIDPDTGEIMAPPASGLWYFRPPQSQDFYAFVMNTTNLYALQKNASSSTVIFQYQVVDQGTYTGDYNSPAPLVALSPTSVTGGVLRDLAAFGNDGKLYVRNYTSALLQVDQYNYGLNGVVTLGQSIFVTSNPSTNILVTNGITFTHRTSVTVGNHTYRASGGSIIHSQNGLDQSSYSFGPSATTVIDISVQ